ncbi:MAG TPA: hypothetical protein VFY39_07715 [Gammaproteobacteria bacterium]|nr:hypothetical protein [Gammaproteobacteria bacterium]
MKLLVLILGLLLEHAATQGLRLREPRWLDSYFDAGLARVKALGPSAALPILLLLLIIAVLPVLAASRLSRAPPSPGICPMRCSPCSSSSYASVRRISRARSTNTAQRWIETITRTRSGL